MEKTDSILDSIKLKLGVEPEDKNFDGPIIDYINSVFAIMTQLTSTLGYENGFEITDNTTTWDDFTKGIVAKSIVKTYVYLRVKMIFDPSASSALNEQYKESIKEFEWRLGIEGDKGE